MIINHLRSVEHSEYRYNILSIYYHNIILVTYNAIAHNLIMTDIVTDGQGMVHPVVPIQRADSSDEFVEEPLSLSTGRVFDLDESDDTLLLIDKNTGIASPSRNQQSKASDEPDSSSANKSKRVLHGVKWSVIGTLFIAGATVATSTFHNILAVRWL